VTAVWGVRTSVLPANQVDPGVRTEFWHPHRSLGEAVYRLVPRSQQPPLTCTTWFVIEHVALGGQVDEAASEIFACEDVESSLESAA
jgi:hypothetical protein